MKLRERQKTFASRAIKNLKAEGNTLGIAPTGAGKTVMMSAILGGGAGQTEERADWGDGPTLVIQHREELVTQNRDTYQLVNAGKSTSIVNANIKDWSGDAVFGMVQTIANRLEHLPEVSVLAIDEAHHATANSYRRIIDACFDKNPDMKLLGVTATPVRGDKTGLRTVFSNVSDQITITELVKAGHLVRPRCFAVDIGVKEQVLGVRKKKNGDFDADEVAAIMDKRVLNERIIEEWAEKVEDRQTVVFCATVDHAKHLAELWRERGYTASHIEGNMSAYERKQILSAYDRGEIQVLTNVMVLTEGWDHQPTSCVVLTRPLSFKGLMLQMIGRGLRKVDPERYPGVKKDDCYVLDFGATLLAHGDLEVGVTLDDDDIKNCPSCEAVVPVQARECALCGHVMVDPEEEDPGAQKEPQGIFSVKEDLETFQLTEIELLDASPFKWEDFWDGKVTLCNGMDAWAALVNYRGRWHALGGGSSGMKMLGDSDDYCVALATADDFMRDNGDTDKGRKTQGWITKAPTAKQAMLLQQGGYAMGDILSMSRYRASCAMTWQFQQSKIRRRLEGMYDAAA